MKSEKILTKYKNLILRFISAVVAVGVLILTLHFFKTTGALFLVLVISTLISFEFSNLFFSSDKYFKFVIPSVILISLYFGLLSYTNSTPGLQDLPFVSYFYLTSKLSLLPIFMVLITLPWAYRLNPIQITFDKLVVYLLVSFYCYFLPLKIFEIFLLDSHFYYFYFFCLLVFGTDTFAYFFGKLFGRKLFKSDFQPQISPSKTVEGFVGSLIWPIVLILIFHLTDLIQVSFVGVLLIFITAFAAISGDLMASLIKRKSLKKDSGSLFIGHGGFLDRLDSLLLSAPFFLMAAPFLKWI